MKGLFIVFEGIDGSGKSTQVAALDLWLQLQCRRLGLPGVGTTLEPGRGIPEVRELLLHRDLDPTSQILLFCADRREHNRLVIGPALRAGKVVLCDRYAPSTLAYQADGQVEKIRQIIDLHHELGCLITPDIVIWCDVVPAVAMQRIRGRGEPNQLEKRLDEISQAYRWQFEHPFRIGHEWWRIDANKPPDDVHEEIKQRLTPVLKQLQEVNHAR